MKNSKTSIMSSLLFLLFSYSLFAQDTLPVENTIFYQVDFLCEAPLLNESIENISCEICRDIEFSIQKDSIVLRYIDGKGCVSSGDIRKVYNPIKSTSLNSNTTLYLLEDEEKNLFKTVIKSSDQKIMVSGPTSTELDLYDHLLFQLDSINNADKEVFVVNNSYRSFYSRSSFDYYSKLPRFTLKMFEDVKADLSDVLPEDLDHSKHRGEYYKFNEILENYFIDNELNPFHGRSFYRSIKNQQKREKVQDGIDEFYAPLRNSIKFLKGLYDSRIYIILLIVLWSVYRVYRYDTYKKLTTGQQAYKDSTRWIEKLSVLAMIGFILSGLLIGYDVGFLIHNILGYGNPEWIQLTIRMIISIPIGGILGILLGVFIARITRLT